MLQAIDVQVGQRWMMRDGEVLEVVTIEQPFGARVRCDDGREYNYTFRSFAGWKLMGTA